MNIKDYPFAQNLITDDQGQIQQVIINFEDYQRMIEAYEDTGLFPVASQNPQYGSAKGIVKMLDNFDDPIEDFEDYMS